MKKMYLFMVYLAISLITSFFVSDAIAQDSITGNTTFPIGNRKFHITVSGIYDFYNEDQIKNKTENFGWKLDFNFRIKKSLNGYVGLLSTQNVHLGGEIGFLPLILKSDEGLTRLFYILGLQYQYQKNVHAVQDKIIANTFGSSDIMFANLSLGVQPEIGPLGIFVSFHPGMSWNPDKQINWTENNPNANGSYSYIIRFGVNWHLFSWGKVKKF